MRGHLTEGRRRLEGALDADDRLTAARAKALNAAADLATGTGDPETAMRRAREGLALNRDLGERWGTADSLLLLGIAHNETGDFARGKELIEESVPLYRELGDDHGVMEATRLLAWSCNQLGDGARQRSYSKTSSAERGPWATPRSSPGPWPVWGVTRPTRVVGQTHCGFWPRHTASVSNTGMRT